MGPPFDSAELAAANLSPRTGLATDYLNHFNEVAMLLGMLPDMPEAAEDILAWRPLPYVEHFQRSGFRARELAIAAWEAADPQLRGSFERELASLEQLVLEAQRRIREEDAQAFAAAAAASLYEAIAALGAVITGEEGREGGIDALLRAS